MDTVTPTSQSSTPTTATALPPVTLSVASPMDRMDEAAYEAFGIIEVLYEQGDIPLLYRDICGVVIAKFRQARREINRSKS